MLRAIAIAAAAAAAIASAGQAQESVDPASLGFSAEGLAALDAHFSQQVEDEVRAGFVVGVARHGELVHTLAVGMADIAAGRPMTLDTQFRLASMTKPVTVVAALTLVDQGKLDLDDPVSVYIPTIANMLVATSPTRNAEGGFDVVPPDPPMTVRNLMTHTSGLSYYFGGPTDLDRFQAEHFPFDNPVDLRGAIEELTLAPLQFQPGERWLYGVSIDVLARVVEVAAGAPFEDYVETAIFAPLGMADTHFYIAPDDERPYAVVYGVDADGDFVAIENLVFGPGDETFPSGGGGLISTMPDYIKLASMLAGGGALGAVRILTPETAALMSTPQLQASQFPRGPDGAPGTLQGWSIEGRNFGLGVQVTTEAELTPQADRDGDFGWNGAYGTDWFASPSTGVAAVIMLQSSGPNRPPANIGGDLRQFVYGAMSE
jgi:CubicO group peptidase (beta-lactamase class C family)